MRTIGSLGIILVCAGTLRAQDSTQATAPTHAAEFRSPAVAAVLGTIVPGAGHIYSTEYLRGVGFYEGTVSTIGLGAMVYVIDKCTFAFDGNCHPGPEWPHQTIGLLFAGAGVAMWVISAIDAPRAARRTNAKHSAVHTQLRPLIAPPPGDNHGVHLGVTIGY